MISPEYRAQVDLLVRILPEVATERAFALKGGTAINLFVRDMPRLSVDIDLTYLPFDARAVALKEIAEALRRIKRRLDKAIPGISAQVVPQSGGQEAKLACRWQNAVVIVEVNTVMRGHLWPVRNLPLTQATQDEFGKFAAINVVSDEELFGGKICAALDRQHPRDLFDMHLVYASGSLSDAMRLGFLASLLSHTRPIHEVIRPSFHDQHRVFETQFAGMAVQPFTYDDYMNTRKRLADDVAAMLTEDDRTFLLSFKSGDPDWSLFPLAELQRMPAVQWKLANILKLQTQNTRKHTEQLQCLKEALLGKA